MTKTTRKAPPPQSPERGNAPVRSETDALHLATSHTASAASACPRGYGLDRTAHDLGDVARGVDHEREEQSEERRVDADAANGLATVEFRQVHS